MNPEERRLFQQVIDERESAVAALTVEVDRWRNRAETARASADASLKAIRHMRGALDLALSAIAWCIGHFEGGHPRDEIPKHLLAARAAIRECDDYRVAP